MPPKLSIKQASFDELKDMKIKSQQEMAQAIARLAELSPPREELLQLLKKYTELKGFGGVPLLTEKSKPLKKKDLSKVVRLATGKEPSKRSQGFTKAQALKALAETPITAPPVIPLEAGINVPTPLERARAVVSFANVAGNSGVLRGRGSILTAIARAWASGVDVEAVANKITDIGTEAFRDVVLGSYNWCGPGTNVFKNIVEGKAPINELDKLCMIHDTDYMYASRVQDDEARSKLIAESDQRLIQRANDLHDKLMADDPAKGSPKKAMAGDAHKVAAVMTGASWAGLTQGFASFNPAKMTLEKREQLWKKVVEAAESIAKDAPDNKPMQDALRGLETGLKEPSVPVVEPDEDGFFDVVEEDLPDIPRSGISPGASAASLREAQEEEKKEEEPAPADVPEGVAGEPLQGGEQVAEVTPVLPEGAAAAVAPPKPKIRADPDEFKEHQKMTPVPSGAIVGERSMRPMAFRMEGDTVEPSKEQIRQNMLWLDNFTWIDEGHGLGNQQRVPWEMGGGAAHNTSFEAQKRNKMMKYSGDLRVGNQHVREVREVTPMTRLAYRTPMYSTTQNRQRMIRNGALPAGLGRTIQMYRDRRDVTPMMYRNAPMFRLENGDVVDGRRL